MKTCGHYGGVNSRGDPCGRAAGWGREGEDSGRCRAHHDPLRSPIADAHGIAHPGMRAVLAAFPNCGTVTAATEAAGVHRRTHYDWLDSSPEYKAAFEDAREAHADVLEAEAVRRAVRGVRKPYVYRGGVARDEHGDPIYLREYSDRLLESLLKANREKFQDRLKHSGEIDTGGVLVVPGMASSEEEWEEQLNRVRALQGQPPSGNGPNPDANGAGAG